MNVEEDTCKHIEHVKMLLDIVAIRIRLRGSYHDASKLYSPEKEMFEEYRQKLDELDIESEEYKQVLDEMNHLALPHHYERNRHHPEHFQNGIRGMTLIDIVEMVCDWKAAASRKGQDVNLQWAHNRFGTDDDGLLFDVIKNTLELFS